MSKLLRDDWRDRKATNIPDAVETEEWLEAVKGDYEPWLDPDAGLAPLHPSELDPLPDLEAPLVATWWLEHVSQEYAAEEARLVQKLQGPHVGVWRYSASIWAEVKRLADACRNSMGTELTANKQHLREVQADLNAFCNTAEFRAALAYTLDQVDAAIASAGKDLSEPQVEARARYMSIRARMATFLKNDCERADSGLERAEAMQSPADKTVQLVA